MSRHQVPTGLASIANRLARGARLLALVGAIAACSDTPPPAGEPPQPALEPAGPATVEILSPGTYRVDEAFVNLDGLNTAFVEAGRGRTDEIGDPLLIVVPASLEVHDAMPALFAALQPPGRTHLTLRVIESGVGREATVPVLTGCACRAVNFVDGGVEPLAHASDVEYVFVTARIAGDGSISAYATDFDAPDARHETALPDRLPPGAPPLDEALDLVALQTWFDALQAADVQPLLCLDYRDTLPVGHLVDALIVTKRVLGKRVLLGPNPREPEPEVEEELDTSWDDE